MCIGLPSGAWAFGQALGGWVGSSPAGGAGAEGEEEDGQKRQRPVLLQLVRLLTFRGGTGAF